MPMSNPTDWLQIYRQNLRPPANSAPPFDGVSASVPPSDATVVTAGVISDASVSQPGSSRLSPDQGRVAKPVRKRSRASRKTQTTLLNTDTSNFRAMVQQFTGGPSGPFALSSSSVPSNLSFEFGQARQLVNPRPIMVPREFQIQAQRNVFHPQNHQQLMFTSNSINQSNSSLGTYSSPPIFDGSTPSNLMGLSGGVSLDDVSPETANWGSGNKFFL